MCTELAVLFNSHLVTPNSFLFSLFSSFIQQIAYRMLFVLRKAREKSVDTLYLSLLFEQTLLFFVYLLQSSKQGRRRRRRHEEETFSSPSLSTSSLLVLLRQMHLRFF